VQKFTVRRNACSNWTRRFRIVPGRSDLIEDLVARLIEKVENRYYGKYRAFVVDNTDPEDRED